MKKFTVILPKEVREYRIFYWHADWDDTKRYLVSLIGFKITEDELMPVFLPRVSFKREPGQVLITLQFSRFKSLAILLSSQGIQTHWEDLKKQIEDQRKDG